MQESPARSAQTPSAPADQNLPGQGNIVGLEDVAAAARTLSSAVVRTPFLLSQTLSDLTGAEIWLKAENLQFTASFKERGALNRLAALDREEARKGVIAVSAGNHAQGVAFHARRLGIPATIVMPRSTPSVKVARTEGFGANVILAGNNFAEASAQVTDLIEKHDFTLIHPFSDPLVIAGQGTVALEMVQDGPELDMVIVPVGGGGLISGVGAVYSALYPRTEIIGVQSELYPSMAQALAGGQSSDVLGGNSVAEGIAVATADALTFSHVKSFVTDIVVIREHLVEDAIALLLQIEKTLCEGAGAAGLAAVLAQPERFRGKRIGLILSGGNIDTRVLTSVLQRHLARAGQLVRLTINALDNAGGLGRIATIIGNGGGNILNVRHERVFGGATARATDVAIDLELADTEALQTIRTNIEEAGFPVQLDPVKD